MKNGYFLKLDLKTYFPGGVIPGTVCRFAIPGKVYRQSYPYPYKCEACFECRYGDQPPNDRKAKECCPRYAIGEAKIKKEGEE